MTERTDMELLTLAAKAAGRQIRWDGNVAVLQDFEPGVDDCSAWCPLTDDGDALRIAVKLGFMVNIEDGKACVLAPGQSSDDFFEAREPLKRDRYAATRRAIVRAAAEIGAAL